ncbi:MULTISPECIES: cold-shock protein [Bacillaceae]|uniref:Cold-shock protein n=1 Tax=Metabacillus sediminis TaxID=3117746 RepID=A0ABZ2NCY4_9BACI|nr:cold-shock protein [Bacillus sp. SJS]KZZ84202.1 cold-shock protein [Bacillus sp. SJS]
MYNKKPVEEIITKDTKIWTCTADNCNCWVRDNFKSSDEPLCPICKSPMATQTKELQVVDNPCSSF